MYTKVWDVMTNSISTTMISRDEDGAFIPFDDSNRDYQEYKEWVKSGNIPKEPTRPEPPIEIVPTPDIHEVNAQVQNIDERLSQLENQIASVQTSLTDISSRMKS